MPNGREMIVKDPAHEQRMLGGDEAPAPDAAPKPYRALPIDDAERREFLAWKAGRRNFPSPHAREGSAPATTEEFLDSTTRAMPAAEPATKRERIVQALKADPSRSNNALGKLLGVDDKTVGRVRRDLEERGEIQSVGQTVGADGKARAATRKAAQLADPLPGQSHV